MAGMVGRTSPPLEPASDKPVSAATTTTTTAPEPVGSPTTTTTTPPAHGEPSSKDSAAVASATEPITDFSCRVYVGAFGGE